MAWESLPSSWVWVMWAGFLTASEFLVNRGAPWDVPRQAGEGWAGGRNKKNR